MHVGDAPENRQTSEYLMDLWPALIAPEFVAELRSFAKSEISPKADEIDRLDMYPRPIIKRIAELGYNTISLDPAYGGGGKPYKYAATVFEEASYASAAVGISLITIFQAQTILQLFGNGYLKTTYLPQFSKGLLSSYALTEASHGSDI